MSIRSGISDGEARHLDGAQQESEHAALLLDARRLADHVDRHLHRDLLVHPHRLEVDVDERVADRIVLELAHDGRPRLGVAGKPEVHENAARAMALEGPLHVRRGDGERHRRAPAAVEDRGDEALPAEAPDAPFPTASRGSTDSSRMFMDRLLGASGAYTNRVDTDSSSWMRRIASARRARPREP